MYKDFINQEVSVLVSTRAENFLEYTGELTEETEKTITLKNANIIFSTGKVNASMFGANALTLKNDIDTTIINKEYILSCQNK